MFAALDDAHVRKLLHAVPSRAVRILYDQYYHTLISYSRRYTGDLTASQDIVQEAFVLVWINHVELSRQNKIPIRGYLFKVIRFKSIDFYRKSQRAQRKSKDIDEKTDVSDHVTVESTMIKQENINSLWSVITSFPMRERECLRMRYEEGLSVEETAIRLGTSRKAVERSLTSAKKRLQKIGKDNIGYF